MPCFERQMAMYVIYHRDRRNPVTHFVGIPLVVVSVLMALSRLRFEAEDAVPAAGGRIRLRGTRERVRLAFSLDSSPRPG